MYIEIFSCIIAWATALNMHTVYSTMYIFCMIRMSMIYYICQNVQYVTIIHFLSTVSQNAMQ